jgi:urease accessory protein
MTPILSILPAGTWDLSTAIDVAELDFDQRYRRRHLIRTAAGRELLLDLPTATRLHQNDGLALPEGIVRIKARLESLLHITAQDPNLLARAAWHLGNRHLPVQFDGPTLLIRADHVIAAMLEGLGCHVYPHEAPFDPEAGAYAAAAAHHHHDH